MKPTETDGKKFKELSEDELKEVTGGKEAYANLFFVGCELSLFCPPGQHPDINCECVND